LKIKFIAVFAVIFALAAACFAESGRQVLVIAASPYPAMAREMRVYGTVKMQAVVASDGKVKEVKVVGGHPLLAEAALESAKKWQFQPSKTETVEVITINFTR
jgi:TonB family protein